jgi:DNA polymerase III delta prime subunit
MEKSYLRKLAESGLSIIPCSETKAPIGQWKKYQTESRTKEQIDALNSPLFGLVTGFSNIEVIDIDLKVFATLKEQNDFWDEYLSFLKDNIDDFDKKFVIYKTKNQGYHILYRCKNIQANTKIAVLENHKEAVIESRGIGGMVIIYENKISKLAYYDIQEITERDREILWYISKSYNHVKNEVVELPKQKESVYNDSIITPWTDYNEKTSIFDIIQDELKIIRQLNDKIILQRIGSDNPTSGSVFKSNGCMYLFSTGTSYPHEKLISPFVAYTYKNHNGDFTAASSELYKQGFGTRLIPKIKEVEKRELPKVNQTDLIFPIDIFPSSIQAYILECNETLDSSIDYMGCSMLWLISVIVGNSIQIEVKKGWNETATIWLAVVGKAGLGKTPSIHNIIKPLLSANNREIKNYIKNMEKFEYYDSLSKKEQQDHEEIKRPTKSQFIANDITIEALVELHQENPNSIGVFKDELAGWFKDMNKYREGSDLEFWLSTWSGKAISLNRKTAKSAFVDKPLVSVLGGIQPSILNSFYTEDNKDNGFMDRMLLSYPDLTIEHWNDKEMNYETIEWFNDSIIAFYETIKHKVVEFNEDGDIKPKTALIPKESKDEWIRVFNEYSDIQNSDEENEYMKSMLPKQKSYLPRFALLINTLDSFFDENQQTSALSISKESILKAEKLSKYFIAMAKKIKVNTIEVGEVKQLIVKNKDKTTKEKIQDIYKVNPDFNRSEIAELLGVSRQILQKYVKECKQV